MKAQHSTSKKLGALALALALGLSVAPLRAVEPKAGPPRLSLGVGYPDLRLRYNAIGDFDVELKGALGDGVQVYSLRGYYGIWQPSAAFKAYAGAEAGLVNFSGVAGISGDGWLGLPFAGLQYSFAKRFSLALDLGPSFVSVSSGGESLMRSDWVANAGLYFTLF